MRKLWAEGDDNVSVLRAADLHAPLEMFVMAKFVLLLKLL